MEKKLAWLFLTTLFVGITIFGLITAGLEAVLFVNGLLVTIGLLPWAVDTVTRDY